MIEWKMITENAHSAANPSKRRTTAAAADGQTTTGDKNDNMQRMRTLERPFSGNMRELWL